MKALYRFSCAALVSFSSLAIAQTPATPIPEVPAALKDLKPALSTVKGALSVSVSAPQPLSAAQWDALASLHARRFSFAENALDDAGMSRLVALDPLSVAINKSLLTGVGVAKFGEMKSLQSIAAMHIVKPTPEAKTALQNHPTVDTFSTDGAFCIEVVTAPNLRSVDLKHGAADDKYIALLAKHPALESVRLWPKGGAWLTDAAFAHLATLPKLKRLTVDLSVLTYAGGLNLLKGLPNLAALELHEVAISEQDLARLKADLPKIRVVYTPMTPEYRAQWDAWAAKKK